MAGSENKSRVFLSIIRKVNIAEELEKGLPVKTLSGRIWSVAGYLENKLYTWFLEQRAMGNPINDLLLQEKRNQLLRQGSADVESAEDYVTVTSFVNRLVEEDIDANRIYNMNETGPLWKTVPSKSLVSNEEGTLTGKKNKEGQNIYWTTQAWMIGDIFREWYENCFKTSVQQYHLEQGISGKVILCVDNCSSHRGIENEDNFELIYLLPNTTSLIQPMDQSVIAKFKVLYRHKVLRRILQYENGATDFYRLFNIKECINFVEEAWMNITPNNIKNSWNKILGLDGREGGIEENENAQELDVSIHSALSDVIHTISGESITYEECQEMLEALN
nr:PREDICTED: jerky protein homolog-like [Megachile rotundata]